MKYTKAAFAAAIVVLMTGLFSPLAQAEVSFSAFYSNLSPYGSWQVSAQYGRVWHPANTGPGWNPYLDGHWVYSDVGWTWVSDYEWGAVPYHYGTWVSDPYNGWVWVPGYTWAPAWVTFRTGPDYIGWAPVAPGFSVGVSAGSGGGPFVFVSAGNFLAPRVRTCIVPQSRTTVIINNTRVVNNLVVENNVVVNRGFNPRIIEKASGRPVREVPIERVSRVAPGPRFTRSQLRVDPEQSRHGLRAAEPVSERQPLPVVRQREGGAVEHHGVPAGAREPTVSTPRGSRRAKPYPEYPGAQQRTPVTESPTMTQHRKVSPAGGASIQPPTHSAPPPRGPAPVANSGKKNEPPARGERPAHKDEKKPHDSGKE